MCVHDNCSCTMGLSSWLVCLYTCISMYMYYYCATAYNTSVKIIKNEVGCRDDTVPKTVDTRRHCEEE